MTDKKSINATLHAGIYQNGYQILQKKSSCSSTTITNKLLELHAKKFSKLHIKKFVTIG